MASTYFFHVSSASFMLLCVALLINAGNGEQCTPACIIPVCKTVGGGSMFFDVQFCEEALGSDWGIADAGMDYRAYAIIAADLLAANATSTAAKIDGLLRNGGGDDEATRGALQSCQVAYGGIVQRQGSCKATIRDKRDAEAISSLERSASAANECENGFVAKTNKSPVTEEGKNTFKLAKLAVALING